MRRRRGSAARRAQYRPLIARLSLSVPPAVNSTSEGRADSAAARLSRDSSITRRAARPVVCSDDALPTVPSAAVIASMAAGYIGVVAAWSRYTMTRPEYRRRPTGPRADTKAPDTPGVRGLLRRAGGRSALAGLDRLGQLRGDVEQVPDDAVVGDLEDRRLLVLVDHHDGLGGLHPGAVLNRPGDPQRDVELRRDGLAGLTDLELPRVVARVDRRTRGADRGPQRVGQLLDHAELVGAADPAATGDHDRGLGELRTVPGDDRFPRGDLGGVLGLLGHLDGDLLAGPVGRLGVDRAGPHGDHRGVAVGLRLHGERTAEDRVHHLGALLDVDDVDEQTRPDARGQPTGDLPAVGGSG